MRESRDTTKFATMWSVLEELKLDDERQKLSNPSLRKNADRSDDALNATANGKCHYCHKPVHFRIECRRRQTDEAKGVQRRSVQDKLHGNSSERGRSYGNGRGGDETDECNAAMLTYKREAIIDNGTTAHITGDIDLLHSVVA
ncbi:hypothetical protein DYB37_008007 [Aphanomyces astaci]|uniref:CCHC-type domain-containing protein n=1 Tax=Aphanomyces astaci TaxID=112090 RepID=A0A418CRH4_APHAT|nr:hypothetical protein DYB35_008171 [Aphanomyces astaci]RHZ23677.1 hypothetical protein DYB37_008007 [Aphanomyces astaci]